MTTPQLAAFWAWWKTGLTGSGNRSFRQASRESHHSLETIIDWHDTFGWSKLATEKDIELQAKMEDAIFRQLLSANEEIIKRQRKVITLFYERIAKEISKISMSLGHVVKLMEYEKTLDIDQSGGAGATLHAIMAYLSPEARSDIYRAIGDAQREGLELVQRSLVATGRD